MRAVDQERPRYLVELECRHWALLDEPDTDFTEAIHCSICCDDRNGDLTYPEIRSDGDYSPAERQRLEELGYSFAIARYRFISNHGRTLACHHCWRRPATSAPAMVGIGAGGPRCDECLLADSLTQPAVN